MILNGEAVAQAEGTHPRSHSQFDRPRSHSSVSSILQELPERGMTKPSVLLPLPFHLLQALGTVYRCRLEITPCTKEGIPSHGQGKRVHSQCWVEVQVLCKSYALSSPWRQLLLPTLRQPALGNVSPDISGLLLLCW